MVVAGRITSATTNAPRAEVTGFELDFQLRPTSWLHMGGSLSHQHARFTKDEFRKCLMALSAESQYLDWLHGRQLGERDRGPGYSRIKSIFQRRYHQDTSKAVRLVQPAWSAHQGGGR